MRCTEDELHVELHLYDIWNECSRLTEKLECKCAELPEFVEESVE